MIEGSDAQGARSARSALYHPQQRRSYLARQSSRDGEVIAPLISTPIPRATNLATNPAVPPTT